MYDRAPRNLTKGKGFTADHVGPGTYDVNEGKKKERNGSFLN